VFPVYFRLTVPPGAVRRSEMMALLGLAATPAALSAALIQAAQEKRPDGLSKARALLERLMDHVETDISPEHISVFINVLLDIGDGLGQVTHERGSFDFSNESRVARVIYHLLKRVGKAQRLPLLKTAISQGSGISVQRYLLAAVADEISKEAMGGDEAILDTDAFHELKATWLLRLRNYANTDQLLMHAQLSRLLLSWSKWGDPAGVREWCEAATTSDEGLLAFLPKFCSYSRSQVMGESAVHVQPRLNPLWLEKYVDIATCASRLPILQQAGRVPVLAQEAVSQFMEEFEMLKVGKNPDGMDAFDD
jgi:predicted KAP-like P-loop ATPase